jgi:hypothetical protein
MKQKFPNVIAIRLNTRKGEALELRSRLQAAAGLNPMWTSPNEACLFILDAGLKALEKRRAA